MPLELGLFLGCKRYGSGAQKHKVSMTPDSEPYRYQIFISDIAGQDIHWHGGNPDRAIREVRHWLATASKRKNLPGGNDILRRYGWFLEDYPDLCGAAKLEEDEATFKEFRQMAADWLKRRR